MKRRLIALALRAFMLHLNVDRANLVCATHSHSAGRPSASLAHAHHNGMPAGHSSATTESKGCETPAQPDCCQALVACSMLLGLDSASVAVASLVSHDNIVVVAQARPISRVAAPEPPPPKA